MITMKPWLFKITVVSLFAIAMGFLEAVVVVYLREIYYPEGFDFPLVIIEPRIFGIELVREVTTLIMLIAIGLLAGQTKNGKFAWFLFAFGVWDIAYYGGLKLFLDWPSSFFTWDILFLIPVTWIGPVLAPIICAFTMIAFGIIVSWFEQQEKVYRFGKLSWFMLIAGAFLIFLSFIQDYSLLLWQEGNLASGFDLTRPGFTETITAFVPEQFNWWLFIPGEMLILTGIVRVYKMNV